MLHVRDIQPVLVNNCLLSFLTAAARSPAAVLCALLFVMPRLARAFITPGKTNAAAGTDTARIAANTNTFPPIQIAPKARVQVFRIAFNISRVRVRPLPFNHSWKSENRVLKSKIEFPGVASI